MQARWILAVLILANACGGSEQAGGAEVDAEILDDDPSCSGLPGQAIDFASVYGWTPDCLVDADDSDLVPPRVVQVDTAQDFEDLFDSTVCPDLPPIPLGIDFASQRVVAFVIEVSGSATISDATEAASAVHVRANGSIGGAQPGPHLLLTGLPKSSKPVQASACISVCDLCP